MRIISKDRIGYHLNERKISFPDVIPIIERVKKEGDIAVRYFAEYYDGLKKVEFEISESEKYRALQRVDPNFLKSLKFAAKNITNFANEQKKKFQDLEIINKFGRFGHKMIPVNKVGCYIPGGNYPLVSTVLMTVIPAKIAGVKEILVFSPNINDDIIVASSIAGADKLFRIGGVHAIAAMAYGTETIPNVDMIVGPGNKYVTAAKKEVYGKVGIDFLAGPSEILIIADDSANSEIIVADLLAQAEHDKDSRCYLVTNSVGLISKVKIQLSIQIEKIATQKIAKHSIKKGLIILCETLDEMIEISNRIAPEHLEIMHTENKLLEKSLTNYGSLFIGQSSAEVFGDYCSGPNHTLPTSGASRYTSGLSILNFLKIQTYQELSVQNLSELISVSSLLAGKEGLHGHQRSAEIRE